MKLIGYLFNGKQVLLRQSKEPDTLNLFDTISGTPRPDEDLRHAMTRIFDGGSLIRVNPKDWVEVMRTQNNAVVYAVRRNEINATMLPWRFVPMNVLARENVTEDVKRQAPICLKVLNDRDEPMATSSEPSVQADDMPAEHADA